MQGSKTPMVVGLIVLIVAAAGIIIYQMRGPAGQSQSQQQGIAARQPGGPGTFTPAPR